MLLAINELPPDKGKRREYARGSAAIRLAGRFSAQTTISLDDPISILNKITEKSDFRYVYNGMVLNSSLSFSFYGISERDIIYVIAPEEKTCKVSIATQTVPDITQQLRSHFDKHWAQHLSDPETAFQRFQDAANPITARENARLNDLQRAKAESTPVGYRKICAKFRRAQEARMLKNELKARQASTNPPSSNTSDQQASPNSNQLIYTNN